MSVRIKDWGKFQHFKDRRPPWIKLYRDILDDIEWHDLDPVAAKCLVMIWLIASENDGKLPDVRKLSFRLRMSETVLISVIDKLSHWLERTDITTISTRYQSDLTETETETETETDGIDTGVSSCSEKPSSKKPKTSITADDMISSLPGLSVEVANDFIAHRRTHRAVLTGSAWKSIVGEVLDSGWPPDSALSEAMAAGWRGIKADWLANRKGARSEVRADNPFAGCQ